MRHDPYSPQTHRSRSSVFSDRTRGEIMASCTTSSRARRAAALPLLFACAVISQARNIFAEEMMPSGSPDDGGVVISDDGGGPMPYGSDGPMPYGMGMDSGPCGYPGYCDGYMQPGACGPSNVGCEEECGGSCWVGAEWLRWRLVGGDKVPPLVTAGPVGSPTAGRLDD